MEAEESAEGERTPVLGQCQQCLILQTMEEVPRERAEYILWLDMDLLVHKMDFVLPFESYEGTDFVLHGDKEQVMEGDPHYGECQARSSNETTSVKRDMIMMQCTEVKLPLAFPLRSCTLDACFAGFFRDVSGALTLADFGDRLNTCRIEWWGAAHAPHRLDDRLPPAAEALRSPSHE